MDQIGLTPDQELREVVSQLKNLMAFDREIGLEAPTLSASAMAYLDRGPSEGQALEGLEKFLESELPRIASLTSGEIRSLIKNLVPEYTPGSEPHPDAGQTRLAT